MKPPEFPQRPPEEVWPERTPCECCDHPLQHLIREVIARYEAPIPPPTHQATIRALRLGLQDWEENQ